jgi:glycosyltransferase involved in cell wall biosynthesis
MKVGILFDADIKNGGSYQMSINNLFLLKKNFIKEKINFIILAHKKHQLLDKLNINYNIIKLTLLDYIFIIFRNIFFVKYLIKNFNFISVFEKKLQKKNISLIIFFFTSYKAFLLTKVNFISTVLDVCHRDFPNFKEVSGKVFFFREYLNKKILPLSSLIMTESDSLKSKIVKFYKLNLDKIISIPNMPSKLMFYEKNIYLKKIKNKFNITSDFYFYPAQFWRHKNHKIILDAVKKLKDRKINVNFVFCGRDKGNLEFIKNKILEFKINENIKILNYVTDKEVFALYKISKALIMPTYFGPTNIPPVEAWSLDVPVAYSSYLSDHGRNAALYFHPDSSDELVEVLLKLQIGPIRKKLILNGRKRLKEICNKNISGHNLLIDNIKKVGAESKRFFEELN